MNRKILGYKFEVERSMNNDAGFIPMDSLKSAIADMSSDGWLRAIYNLLGESRPYGGQIDLPYEAIAELNEQQIIDLIEQEIKIKHNL